MAAGNAASSTSGANSGFSGAGNTQAEIYGTAGRQANPSAWLSTLGSGLQAGGAVGAAAVCPARGAKIRTKRGDIPVEQVQKGDQIYQSDASWWTMDQDPVIMYGARCVTIITDDQQRSTVSDSHCFQGRNGGYYVASDCLHRRLRVPGQGRLSAVIAVKEAGEQEVFDLQIKGNHTYLCDGIWSVA
jgi:hypothetical protein